MNGELKFIIDRKGGVAHTVQDKKVLPGFNDLMTINPLLADEWDYELNYPYTPSDITSCSHRMSYWKCKFGHSWKTRVIDRNNGKGCPICAGRRIISGINDLKTLFPDIAKEWHPTKNRGIEPSSVTAHSNTYAWWLCEKGHEWYSQINNRTNGTGCPYCNQNRLIPEKTSLAVINPVLATQWHYEKNGERTPWNTSAFSNDKFWWKCEKGHEWETTVSSRSYGSGCPYCSGRNVIKGETDLAAIMPELASQWNYEKNNQLQPDVMSVHSNKKVWWKCENGHEWRATIVSRSNGCGCPYCSGHKIVKGETDLCTLNPELASQWDYEKNNQLQPNGMSVHSNKKVWWKCENGHEWRATIASRSNGCGCPVCLGRRPMNSKLI